MVKSSCRNLNKTCAYPQLRLYACKFEALHSLKRPQVGHKFRGGYDLFAWQAFLYPIPKKKPCPCSQQGTGKHNSYPCRTDKIPNCQSQKSKEQHGDQHNTITTFRLRIYVGCLWRLVRVKMFVGMPAFRLWHIFYFKLQLIFSLLKFLFTWKYYKRRRMSFMILSACSLEFSINKVWVSIPPQITPAM